MLGHDDLCGETFSGTCLARYCFFSCYQSQPASDVKKISRLVNGLKKVNKEPSDKTEAIL